ncbi:hypothetical protein GN958_ATG16506 [Phytophthora infestans]|uniref:Uncharacterized protein n=1 Tax=Phytophthora infestans TaxID=4787 RepID=A0A8S9U676_PHYIN|nr:hypothetical protein GN958_ATG16506 [Phytophthora infestans]
MTARAREQHGTAASGGASSGGRGLSSGRPQLQTNFTQRSGNGKQPRQRGGRYGGNRSRSVSSNSSTGSRTSIMARKKNSTCKVCGQKGHWKGDRECKGANQQAAGNQERNQRVQAFSGGVFTNIMGGAAHQQPQSAAAGFTFDEVRHVLASCACGG